MSITSRINEMSSHIEQAYDELQGLGADLTNVNKNIENISMVLDDIYDSMPQVSGEGTSLTLDDTRVGKIKSTLKGNTSQSGTPTPTSPIPVNVVSGDNEIEVCGKNLHDFSYWIQNINQGTNITYSNRTDSSVDITASARGFTAFGYNQSGGSSLYRAKVEPNTEYTFSYNGEFISGTQGIGTFVFMADNINGDYTTLKVKDVSTNVTFTTTSTTNYIWFRIDLYNVCTYRISNIQLEKGSTASEYSPYQGNTYNIDLGGLGKNKFDINSITKGIELNSNTGQTQVNSSWWTSAFIPIKPNQAYTSSNISSNSKCWYDNNKNFISYVQSQTATSPANAKYLRVNGTISSIESQPNAMIEEGNSVTTFEAYNSIELCKIGNYQDYIYKDSDKWYLHKEIGKVVLNGSETISSYDATSLSGSYQATFEITTKSTSTEKIVLSNYFASALLSDRTTKTNICYTYSDGLLRIATNLATTMADFKAWLSTHNVVVYYVLATPVNTALEDM